MSARDHARRALDLYARAMSGDLGGVAEEARGECYDVLGRLYALTGGGDPRPILWSRAKEGAPWTWAELRFAIGEAAREALMRETDVEVRR